MMNGSTNLLNSEAAEESLLATLIRYPNTYDELYVKPEFLSNKINQDTLKTIIHLREGGYELDIATLLEEMTNTSSYDSKTLYERLTALVNSEFQTTNLKYHQDKLIEFYKKRKLKAILEETLHNLNVSSSNNAFKSIADKFETIEAISADIKENGHISDIMQEVYESLEVVDDKNLKKTHFKNLDNLIAWKRQDFVILGARPSMGLEICPAC